MLREQSAQVTAPAKRDTEAGESCAVSNAKGMDATSSGAGWERAKGAAGAEAGRGVAWTTAMVRSQTWEVDRRTCTRTCTNLGRTLTREVVRLQHTAAAAPKPGAVIFFLFFSDRLAANTMAPCRFGACVYQHPPAPATTRRPSTRTRTRTRPCFPDQGLARPWNAAPKSKRHDAHCSVLGAQCSPRGVSGAAVSSRSRRKSGFKSHGPPTAHDAAAARLHRVLLRRDDDARVNMAPFGS